MGARLGQNFLYQPAWQRRAVEAAGLTSGDHVLEIGGGPGAVSSMLAAVAGTLAVVEIDPGLAAGLVGRFAGQPNVEVLPVDFLELDLTGLAQQRGISHWRVFGNLPYYITSPILLRLFHHSEVLRDATVMVQREVGDRLLAQPGGSSFGLLSATARFYCRPRRLFDLPPGAFRPAPQVHSTLLHLEFVPQAGALGVDAAGFEAFLRTAFARKRKMLAGNLRLSFPAEAVGKALASAGVAATARAEQLDLPAMAAIWRGLSAPNRGTG